VATHVPHQPTAVA